jgi:hypothetical protein
MQEAQDLFGLEFDAPPPPVLDLEDGPGLTRLWRVDLDRPGRAISGPLGPGADAVAAVVGLHHPPGRGGGPD